MAKRDRSKRKIDTRSIMRLELPNKKRGKSSSSFLKDSPDSDASGKGFDQRRREAEAALGRSPQNVLEDLGRTATEIGRNAWLERAEKDMGRRGDDIMKDLDASKTQVHLSDVLGLNEDSPAEEGEAYSQSLENALAGEASSIHFLMLQRVMKQEEEEKKRGNKALKNKIDAIEKRLEEEIDKAGMKGPSVHEVPDEITGHFTRPQPRASRSQDKIMRTPSLRDALQAELLREGGEEDISLAKALGGNIEAVQARVEQQKAEEERRREERMREQRRLDEKYGDPAKPSATHKDSPNRTSLPSYHDDISREAIHNRDNRPEHLSGSGLHGERRSDPMSGSGLHGERRSNPLSGSGLHGERHSAPLSSSGLHGERHSDPMSGSGLHGERHSAPLSSSGLHGEREALSLGNLDRERRLQPGLETADDSAANSGNLRSSQTYKAASFADPSYAENENMLLGREEGAFDGESDDLDYDLSNLSDLELDDYDDYGPGEYEEYAKPEKSLAEMVDELSRANVEKHADNSFSLKSGGTQVLIVAVGILAAIFFFFGIVMYRTGQQSQQQPRSVVVHEPQAPAKRDYEPKQKIKRKAAKKEENYDPNAYYVKPEDTNQDIYSETYESDGFSNSDPDWEAAQAAKKQAAKKAAAQRQAQEKAKAKTKAKPDALKKVREDAAGNKAFENMPQESAAGVMPGEEPETENAQTEEEIPLPDAPAEPEETDINDKGSDSSDGFAPDFIPDGL